MLLDEAKKLNEIFRKQFSSQWDKIISLEEKLVESKSKLDKETSEKSVIKLISIEKNVYVTPFKRNHKNEYKTNVARVDKGKRLKVETHVPKPMSRPNLVEAGGSRLYQRVTIVYH